MSTYDWSEFSFHGRRYPLEYSKRNPGWTAQISFRYPGFPIIGYAQTKWGARFEILKQLWQKHGMIKEPDHD